MNEPRPLLMVSNDDGVNANGLKFLLKTLAPIGDVIAVAPTGPQSAKSSAITVEQPLRIIEYPAYDGVSVRAVNGTPVDCVKLGLHAVVPRRPDIMISGINHGSNAGNSVIYSGTMAAAMEACMVGIPAIGFSLLNFDPNADFSGCREFVENITKSVLKCGLPEGVCLNVNIPDLSHPEGIKVVRSARGYWTEEYVEMNDPHGRPFWWLTGRFHNIEPDNPETDEYWLKRGYVTVVPVRVDQSAHDCIDIVNDIFQ